MRRSSIARERSRCFGGFDESWSPWDGYHRVFAHQRLGEIAEAEGRVDDALHYYGLLIDLWRDCDEGLVPLREEIRCGWIRRMSGAAAEHHNPLRERRFPERDRSSRPAPRGSRAAGRESGILKRPWLAGLATLSAVWSNPHEEPVVVPILCFRSGS